MLLWDCDNQPCWSNLYHHVEIENQPEPCDVVRHTKLFLDASASTDRIFPWSSDMIRTVWRNPRRGHHRAPVHWIVWFRAARVGRSFCSRKIDEAEETEYRGVVWRWIQKTAAAIEITRTVVSSNQASSWSTPVGSVGGRNVILSTEWRKIPTGYNMDFHTFESTRKLWENFLTNHGTWYSRNSANAKPYISGTD